MYHVMLMFCTNNHIRMHIFV